MLRDETLFVVGAGASFEVGMPIGNALRDQIALVLGDFPEAPQRVVGHLQWAVEDAAFTTKRQSHELIVKAKRISRALAQAPSIDAYVESQQHDPDVALLGKLAIAACLLDHENRSDLFHEARGQRTLDHKKLTDSTWLGKLFQILVDGRSRKDVDRLFEHASFVVFNYDRCVEQYMRFAIENYFPDLERGRAAEIVRTCRILHPYGSLGSLDDLNDASYGASSRIGLEGLKKAASRLRTYSEYVEDAEAIASARESFGQVKMIVFLGFGFLPQNVRLLRTMLPKLSGEAMATVWGMPEPIHRVIKTDIASIMHRPVLNVRTTLANSKCAQFLEDYRALLMSRSARNDEQS